MVEMELFHALLNVSLSVYLFFGYIRQNEWGMENRKCTPVLPCKCCANAVYCVTHSR